MVAEREVIDVDAAAAPSFGLADELNEGASDWHAHRRHQLLYAAEGALTLEVADGQWLLPPQRAAWIPARTRHRVVVRGRAALRTVYLATRGARGVPTEVRVFALPALGRELTLEAMRFTPDGRDGGAGGGAVGAGAGAAGAGVAAAALAATFFTLYARLCAEWAAHAGPFRLPAARTAELGRALAVILERLHSGRGQELTLPAVARATGLSTRSLVRRFADETGTSFRTFVQQARMLRALELLALPGARVGAVAGKLGFASAGAFSHAFKLFAGETAKDYRKRQGAGAATLRPSWCVLTRSALRKRRGAHAGPI
ncbi:MAG: helix-turn-helix transcriptional regulator [Deltaproteobacteria bacterium]|nr:helix-turn-helix transcriptional regulator [Deltaproteobacteria bacterium]